MAVIHVLQDAVDQILEKIDPMYHSHKYFRWEMDSDIGEEICANGRLRGVCMWKGDPTEVYSYEGEIIIITRFLYASSTLRKEYFKRRKIIKI